MPFWNDNTKYKFSEILQIASKRLCMTILCHILNFMEIIDLKITTQLFKHAAMQLFTNLIIICFGDE